MRDIQNLRRGIRQEGSPWIAGCSLAALALLVLAMLVMASVDDDRRRDRCEARGGRVEETTCGVFGCWRCAR